MARGRSSLRAARLRSELTAPRGVVALARRRWSRARVAMLVAATAAVDTGSPRLRYGVGREVRRLLWSRPLVSLTDSRTPGSGPVPPAARPGLLDAGSAPVVLLLTRSLGIGGVESIVSSLAQGLPACGLRPVVLCETGGATADALTLAGVEVVVCADRAGSDAFLDLLVRADVAELHNAPDHLIEACRARGIPLVRVLHTTNVNVSPEELAHETALTKVTAGVIAVSRTVADSSGSWRPAGSPEPVVVPNGITPVAHDPAVVVRARRALGEVLSRDLADDVVVCCLARYDYQKNLPALVSAFLDAAATRPHLRLVLAGPVQDWVEHALAEAIRSSHRAADQVHLMGPSSAPLILAAADVFALDSFFEGWPVAATEAACAGLPLVLSEVGGARELVGDLGERGWVVANPAAAPAQVTDPMIEAARRGVLAQRNRAELVAVIGRAHDEVDDWRARRSELSRSATQLFSSDLMVQRHADVLVGVLGEHAEMTEVSGSRVH